MANPKESAGSMKPPMHLVPAVANVYEAQVMGGGAAKYGPFNWRETPVNLTTYIGAVDRHLAALKDGQDIDPESGLPHAAHIRANTGILLDAAECGTLIDDRPKVPGKAADVLEKLAGSLSYKGGEVSPPPPPETRVPSPMEKLKSRLLDLGCPEDEAEIISSSATFAHTTRANVPRVYIAGPMRGYNLFNFPAFDKARDRAAANGFDVLSPADMDRAAGLDETDTTIDVDGDEQTNNFIRRDVFALLSLQPENGDGIVMLPGWEKSTGALAEFFVARWKGLKVYSFETSGLMNRDMSSFEMSGLMNFEDINAVNILASIRTYLEGQK